MAVTETSRSYQTPPGEEPSGAQRIADLERRVRDLEAGARMAEAERDELARSCDNARAAQVAAEDATRAREDILAAVAHDLRNPLGSIVMSAATLRHLGSFDDPRAQRIEPIAERIHRQAERMARQISDLADLVEIQAGRLEIHRADHAPCAIVGAASRLVGPIARERGVAFETRAAVDLPHVDCDCQRVVQALSSLVASAVKVTERGGAIEVGAQSAENRGVVFFVRDSGPGIARDELPALFAKACRRRQLGERGAGMDFVLARGVVDAHGGQIWAESEPSIGSTVFFSVTPPNN